MSILVGYADAEDVRDLLRALSGIPDKGRFKKKDFDKGDYVWQSENPSSVIEIHNGERGLWTLTFESALAPVREHECFALFIYAVELETLHSTTQMIKEDKEALRAAVRYALDCSLATSHQVEKLKKFLDDFLGH